MTIPEIVKKKGFAVTSELSPPKGVDCQKVLKLAEDMSCSVDAINVTDGQSAVMRLGSLPLCHLLMDHGVEPVLQLTCRDRNRIALQAELLNAYTLGIRNVLCLTGDHIALGDHPDAKQVYDLDSVSLLWAAQKLNQGHDMHENSLDGATDLCVGAVVNPSSTDIEPQMLKMKRKIKAGARFFQTQAVFDMSNIEPFVAAAREAKLPFLIGILLLKSAKMAQFVNKNVSGITVPDALVTELENSKDSLQTGIEIAARTIREARSICEGVHIMTVGREDLVVEIARQAGLPA